MEHTSSKKAYEVFKRIQDIFFSLLFLLILLPFFLIFALVIVIDSPGNPIFTQKRVGKNGREFKFFKFRTMVKNAEGMVDDLSDQNEMDGPVFKIKDDPRITRVGKFLRKTSIDELPQLINILIGDMSFVGPRPPLPREVAVYEPRHMQRLSVMPGLTCYWQVKPNRNDIPFEEWFELDMKYIEKRSTGLDWKLVFMTFKAVFGMEGE